MPLSGHTLYKRLCAVIRAYGCYLACPFDGAYEYISTTAPRLGGARTRVPSAKKSIFVASCTKFHESFAKSTTLSTILAILSFLPMQIAIIGAGASGMMIAATLLEQ